MYRDVLVGQCPGVGGHPDYPLYCLPRHMSGGRLQRKLGISRRLYLRLFTRVNVMRHHQPRWNASVRRSAKENARTILANSSARTVYVFGALVAEAFGITVDWFSSQVVDEVVVVKCPHPSGLNRLWNDPSCERKLREAFCRESPWIYADWTSRRE